MLFPEHNRKITTYVITSILSTIGILLFLPGCQTVDHQSSDKNSSSQAFPFFEQGNLDERIAELDLRESELDERAAAISARESELVTVFAEVLKQKEHLELQQSQITAQAATENQPPKAPASQSQKPVTRNPQNQSATPQNTKSGSTVVDKRKILGGLEYVFLDPPGINLSARIDTGAQTSSLNALDMVEFERDGKPYIKFYILDPDSGEKIEIVRRVRGHTKIKKHKIESQRRPIVRLRVKLGDLDEHISFTLIDRSKFQQQVLVGRNFLRDLAIVDVSKEYTIPKTTPEKQP